MARDTGLRQLTDIARALGARSAAHLRALAGDRRASVVVIAAVALPIILGFAALSAEYGSGLLAQVENQRVADGASYAAALAYSASNDEDAMVAAAAAIATLNGLAASELVTVLAPSPRDSAMQVVHVRVTTDRTLLLAPILGVEPSLPVRADSYASLGGEGEPSCILALDGTGSGVTLSGGVSVNAPACAVSSNTNLTAPCGTSVVAHLVTYNTGSDINDCQWSVNVSNGAGGPAPTQRVETPDPFAGHAGVTALAGRFGEIAAQEALAPLSVPVGQNIDFAWNQNATRAQASAAGCTANFSSSVWTLSCPPGNYSFGTITVGGGIGVDFNTAGASSNSYTFSGPIVSSGNFLRFGSGNFTMARGVISSGNAQTSFGAGVFNVGASASTNCDSAGRVSLCKTGSSTLSFSGPSVFNIYGGVAASGSNAMTLGAGTANRYVINASNAGFGIWVGGGSRIAFANATSAAIDAQPGEDPAARPRFRLHGNLFTGGGSCLTLPAAERHDLAGNVDGGGGIAMGAGTYWISGYFALGANGRGSVRCDGTNVSLFAADVTLVIGGNATAAGSCSGQSFCATAGYNAMTLSAPATGPYAGLAIVGPQPSAATAGALFSGGASGGRISGAFYFPRGPIRLDGGAGASGGESDCLQLIGATITLSGGTSAASECVNGNGANGGGTIAWVQ